MTHECTIVGIRLQYNMTYGKKKEKNFLFRRLCYLLCSSVLLLLGFFFTFHDLVLITEQINKWYSDGSKAGQVYLVIMGRKRW